MFGHNPAKKTNTIIMQDLGYSFDYHQFQLDGSIRGYVRYCWLMTCEEKGAQKVPDLLIPDGYAEIIFVFHGDYEKKSVNHLHDIHIISDSCIVGLQTHSQLARKMGASKLLGIKLTPVGFQKLCSALVDGSRNKNIPFKDSGQEWLLHLEQRLSKMQELVEIRSLLNKEMANRLSAYGTNPNLELTKAMMQDILRGKGNIKVGDLSERHGKSVRQIQRYFKKFFDISPKSFIQIIRFKFLYKESILEQIHPEDYLDYGYFDQNHFIKDFRKILGITPKLSTEKRFLQKNEMARKSRL